MGLVLLSFVVPVLPVIVTWDGVVSALRTYNPAELDAMVRPLAAEDYEWEAGRIPGVGAGPGWPTRSSSAPTSSAMSRWR